MRRVEIRVTTVDGKDEGAVPITVEEDRGAGQVRIGGRDYTANSKEPATYELRPGQRLVIDGYPEQQMAVDHEQNVAYNPATQRNPEGKLDKPTASIEELERIRKENAALRKEVEEARVKRDKDLADQVKKADEAEKARVDADKKAAEQKRLDDAKKLGQSGGSTTPTKPTSTGAASNPAAKGPDGTISTADKK